MTYLLICESFIENVFTTKVVLGNKVIIFYFGNTVTCISTYRLDFGKSVMFQVRITLLVLLVVQSEFEGHFVSCVVCISRHKLYRIRVKVRGDTL